MHRLSNSEIPLSSAGCNFASSQQFPVTLSVLLVHEHDHVMFSSIFLICASDEFDTLFLSKTACVSSLYLPKHSFIVSRTFFIASYQSLHSAGTCLDVV